MVAFIIKEAEDKASEIEIKAQEDTNIETNKIINSQKQKITQEFERKEKQVKTQKKNCKIK